MTFTSRNRNCFRFKSKRSKLKSRHSLKKLVHWNTKILNLKLFRMKNQTTWPRYENKSADLCRGTQTYKPNLTKSASAASSTRLTKDTSHMKTRNSQPNWLNLNRKRANLNTNRVRLMLSPSTTTTYSKNTKTCKPKFWCCSLKPTTNSAAPITRIRTRAKKRPL